MRVVLVNFAHAAELATPDALLDDYRSLTGWAQGLRAAGAEVAVVQGFGRDARRRRDGVRYQLVAGSYAPRLPPWRIPRRALRAIRALRPDVVHLNGLLYALQARALRMVLSADCALALQHHAERPARGAARVLQRFGLAAADGFLFTGLEMARPWQRRRLIRPNQPVFEILEGSSSLEPQGREAARAATGMRGSPICIWLANLHPGKDPLTVLDGFERALAGAPEARLYMAYRHADLGRQVRRRVEASAALRAAVELLGPIPYGELAAYLSSADLFLQGSHYEGSGYALVDALACGVVPLVTDIPSFRFITGGDCGALWPPGDAAALEAAILEVLARPLAPQRQACRRIFEQRLSFEAIGRQAAAAYRRLIDARRRAQITS